MGTFWLEGSFGWQGGGFLGGGFANTKKHHTHDAKQGTRQPSIPDISRPSPGVPLVSSTGKREEEGGVWLLAETAGAPAMRVVPTT